MENTNNEELTKFLINSADALITSFSARKAYKSALKEYIAEHAEELAENHLDELLENLAKSNKAARLAALQERIKEND